jgi:uncharacterized membrane protein
LDGSLPLAKDAATLPHHHANLVILFFISSFRSSFTFGPEGINVTIDRCRLLVLFLLTFVFLLLRIKLFELINFCFLAIQHKHRKTALFC